MKPILVTMGEPAGIGPDLCLALNNHQLPLVVIGDEDVLAKRAKALGQTIHDLDILQVDGLTDLVIPGEVNTKHAPFVMHMLDDAVKRTLNYEFSAIVTAPIHKGILNEAGFQFSGHTEFLANRCNTPSVVMLLTSGDMRVALATTHLPLKSVPDAITASRLEKIIRIIHTALQQDFAIENPKIGVAGLNPHAGEGGHIGREEIEVISPTLAQLKKEGINVRGPMPADTLFTKSVMKDFDVLLAMYHDQGLPVLKHASFGKAVNITLGLPIIRTSVDHGTALELAGSGLAHTGSLFKAVDEAEKMVHAREAKKCQSLA